LPKRDFPAMGCHASLPARVFPRKKVIWQRAARTAESAAIIHDAMMEASKTTDHVYLQKVIRTDRFCNYHAKGYAGKAWASAVTRNCKVYAGGPPCSI
jgi:hypothetical protein